MKEKIIQLRKEGKTIKQICTILNCAQSTVSYHLYDKTKQSTKNRAPKNKKIYLEKNPIAYKLGNFLYSKRSTFNQIGEKTNKRSAGKFKKSFLKPNFSMKELLDKIGPNPRCYLTNTSIDLRDKSSYSLDHIIPVCQGGDNKLENLGLCLTKVNQAKGGQTVEQFLQLCKLVLEANGFIINPI